MRRVLAVFLALVLIGSAALAERYESTLGYSLELPEGWMPFNADTYEEVLATASDEERAMLEQFGLTGEATASVIALLTAAGIEILMSEEAMVTITIEGDEATFDALMQRVEAMRDNLQREGVSDAVSGPAVFGGNQFAAVVYSVQGAVHASYLYPAPGRIYTLSFIGASDGEISDMLEGALLQGTAGAEAPGEPGGMFSLDGALKPRQG